MLGLERSEMKLQTSMDREPPGGVAVALGFEDDFIAELAHRIAALTAPEARQLSAYLKEKGIECIPAIPITTQCGLMP